MDRAKILSLHSHPQTDNENDYSEMCVKNSLISHPQTDNENDYSEMCVKNSLISHPQTDNENDYSEMCVENSLISHPQTDNENDYSETCVENKMNESYQIEQLPESPMDFCDDLQDIESKLDIKYDLDLDKDEDIFDEFQDIIGDLNGMFDEYTYPLNDINYYRENYSDLITETKALSHDSNVVLRESVYQDETDIVAFNNGGKIGIEIAPLSTYQAVKDDETHESKINSSKKSLPSFQEAFKMFINVSFHISTQENLLNHNVQHEVNADNSKYIDNYKQNALYIKRTNITDETEYDFADITLVEDQTETYESILSNGVKLIENAKATDEFAGKLKAKTKEDDSDCPGYHSSDFEFISESEAEMDGLVIYDPALKSRKKNIKAKIHIVKDSDNNNSAQVYLLHEDNHSRRDETHRDEKFINDHKIPEGEDFFNLFQGNNEPILPMYYMMENKSLGANSCMAIQSGGMGFDMRMMGRDDTDNDELKEDAKRSVNKILDMYPFENCKLKRSHRLTRR